MWMEPDPSGLHKLLQELREGAGGEMVDVEERELRVTLPT